MEKGNEPLRQFDAQVKSILAPILVERGFERVGRTRLWARASAITEGAQQLVWVQVGESASMQRGRYTVEFGIYYPKFDRFASGRRALNGVAIGSCHFDMRTRLGLMMLPAEDRWWRYDTDMTETTRLVTDLGLPWLAATDTEANAALYNTGKVPEPDRLRRKAFEQHRAKRIEP